LLKYVTRNYDYWTGLVGLEWSAEYVEKEAETIRLTTYQTPFSF